MSKQYPGGFITKSPVALTSSAASGMWTLDQAMQNKQAGTWPVPIAVGQVAYTTAGTYSWVAPAGVTSVSVVAVGGGGGGVYGDYPNGGYGGSLGYKNNYTVTPGSSYTVVVGAAGIGQKTTGASPTSGGDSYFVATNVCWGGGGGSGNVSQSGTFWAGTGGGTGGKWGDGSGRTGGGGGGAGGYGGNGGNGGVGNYISNSAGSNGSAGTGGGGGGGAGGGGYYYEFCCTVYNNIHYGGGAGGGVGILGSGSNGTAGNGVYQGWGGNGGAGSGGSGQTYGGGGAGGGNNALNGTWLSATDGGGGAVRILWPGTTRSFPSTNTGNL